MLKAIHAQESWEAADRKARAIVDDLRAAGMNTAANLVEGSVYETLTFYAFPDIHWQKIRTARADHERDSPKDPCRWSVPRRPVMPQPGGRAAALHRRHGMVRQVLHEYATSLSAAGRANRSRIKGAKDSGHRWFRRCWIARSWSPSGNSVEPAELEYGSTLTGLKGPVVSVYSRSIGRGACWRTFVKCGHVLGTGTVRAAGNKKLRRPRRRGGD